MIDPMQLPILMKAIDFVFEEGHKILEERRERRKMQVDALHTETPAPVGEPAAPLTPAPAPNHEEVKQELLTSKIDEILWKNHEAEVQHLVRLLETYSRNYYLSKEQYAKWGSALVPPIILSNMTEAENAMLATIKQLETTLSAVYKKDIQIEN
jgi:hypothetical protein